MHTRAMMFALMAMAAPAAAQDIPKAEVSAGYALQQVGSQLHEVGWYADVSFNANRVVGIVGEAAGSYDSSEEVLDAGFSRLESSSSMRLHSGSAGLRVNVRPNSRTTAYLQVLAGVAQLRVSASLKITTTVPPITFLPGFGNLPALPSLPSDFSTSATRTHALVRAGGGVMLELTERIGGRVGIDYGGMLGDGSPPGGLRLTTGLAVIF